MSHVAVWMTVYNEERFVTAAIKSVLSQTYENFTLYISDNHSTDESSYRIKAAAQQDARIVTLMPPEHLPGIEHMRHCWAMLDGMRQDYTVHIGGHDYWDPNFLDVMVRRHEREADAYDGRPIAIVYPDTWQIDKDDKLVGHYKDVVQTTSGVPILMLPIVHIASVSSPQLFGVWRESIRKQIPIRHACSGWDHLIVMEASLYGAILFESSTRLLMRCPPGDASLESYGQRHLSGETLANGPRDFFNQMEWCVHATDKALETIPEAARPLYKALMTSSIFGVYMALRGLNLHTVPGAMLAFNKIPEVQQMFSAADHIGLLLRQLTAVSHLQPPPVANQDGFTDTGPL